MESSLCYSCSRQAGSELSSSSGLANRFPVAGVERGTTHSITLLQCAKNNTIKHLLKDFVKRVNVWQTGNKP